GTGNIVEAVRHLRTITDMIRRLSVAPTEELMTMARDLGAPYEIVREVAKNGKLPVVLFCAGGVATPADAALVMQLGAEGVFVGSGIFKSGDPARRGKAIVEAVTHFRDAKIIAEVSRGLGDAMSGLEIGKLPQESLMAPRGW
ncbi:MAG TPA: pyridoxal 5'-phosphate synthase lyase subunit PdxS, partial [Thermomicrobiales bacterium]